MPGVAVSELEGSGFSLDSAVMVYRRQDKGQHQASGRGTGKEELDSAGI